VKRDKNLPGIFKIDEPISMQGRPNLNVLRKY
jgi:hypothetical protein